MAGVFIKPKGIIIYLNSPYLHLKVIFYSFFSLIRTRLNLAFRFILVNYLAFRNLFCISEIRGIKYLIKMVI